MGLVPAHEEFLAKARELCDKHDALLIFDVINQYSTTFRDTSSMDELQMIGGTQWSARKN